MGRGEAQERGLWSIPPTALPAWLDLQAGLEEVGTVECQTQDYAAWWPHKRDLDSPATHGAKAACRLCPLRGPCAEYAIAADERFGVWGATLPEERRAIRRVM
ncbi:WhiB family transcriptional regulator [Geodermatophilus sp. SYSU D00691]